MLLNQISKPFWITEGFLFGAEGREQQNIEQTNKERMNGRGRIYTHPAQNLEPKT